MRDTNDDRTGRKKKEKKKKDRSQSSVYQGRNPCSDRADADPWNLFLCLGGKA